jgi:hypothetical protein
MVNTQHVSMGKALAVSFRARCLGLGAVIGAVCLALVSACSTSDPGAKKDGGSSSAGKAGSMPAGAAANNGSGAAGSAGDGAAGAVTTAGSGAAAVAIAGQAGAAGASAVAARGGNSSAGSFGTAGKSGTSRGGATQGNGGSTTASKGGTSAVSGGNSSASGGSSVVFGGTSSSSGGSSATSAGTKGGGAAGLSASTAVSTGGAAASTTHASGGVAGAPDTTTIHAVTAFALSDKGCNDCLTQYCTHGIQETEEYTYLPLCDEISGNAEDGPAAGTSKKQLCLNYYQCIIDNHCATLKLGTKTVDLDVITTYGLNLNPCYCGTASSTACMTQADGVCKSQAEAAMESDEGAIFVQHGGDATLAIGYVSNLLACAAKFCGPECIRY